MARLLRRPKTPARPLKARQLEQASLASARQRYHALASMYHGGLDTHADRELLVEEMPLIAARLFYYFDDREIGALLVERYAEDTRFELREIAGYVAGVLNARAVASNDIAAIAGMRTLPGELLEELAQQPDSPYGAGDRLHQGAEQFEAFEDGDEYSRTF